ncbi:LacI family DNA-binding transcriptional regulator [Pseudoduganella ginsengisoli]
MAGVSEMTVSRVMNHSEKVHEETRKKVMEAMAALNYTPNQMARGLAGARVVRAGFMYSYPAGPYLTEFLRGLLAAATLDNVQLVVEKCELGKPPDAPTQRLLAQELDGVILPPPLCDLAAITEPVLAAGIPLVAVACGPIDSRINAIMIDDRQAAYDMTRHLLDLGHRRIGFIAGNPGQSVTQPRLDGFRAAMAEGGGDLSPELVVPGMFHYRSGLEGAETLLALAQRPSAIFASNDDMAAGAVAVAHKLGLGVPGDLTVVGFDDTALATTIWPELTTVRQPIAEMAEMAVRRLAAHVRGMRLNRPEPVAQQMVDYALIRRQSDAAPRARPKAHVA